MIPEDISTLRPSKYLSHDDLKGRTLTLKIESVEQEEIALGGSGKEWETVIRFEGVPKPLISNPTNDFSLAVLLGRKPPAWAGKRVSLMPSLTAFGSAVVPCIRIAGSPDAEPERAQAFGVCKDAAEAVDIKKRSTLFVQELKRTLATIDPITAKKESKK